MAKDKPKGILQKAAEKIILEVEQERYESDPEAYMLNRDESRSISRVMNEALVWSAVLGALGVIILFCTKYAFPAWFPKTTIYLPWIDVNFQYNIVFFIYGLVLAYIELYILYYVNLKAIKKLIVICNYPHPSHPDFKEEISRLAQVGLEKSAKHGKEIGMNPYQGVPRFALTAYLLINFYKAALSNIVIRIIVTRIGGRTLGRVFIDMLGVPVFAFWNVLASRKILNEARIRIFSRPLTDRFVKQLSQQYSGNRDFKSFIYDTLQYISIIKRNYNYTHYMFGKRLLDAFNIEVVVKHDLPENYFERLASASDSIKRGIEKVILFGMIIDGRISTSERVMIRKAMEIGVITSSMEEIEQLCKNYFKGKGLPGLVS